MLFKKTDKLNMFLGPGTQITGDIESTGTSLLEGSLFGNLHGEKIIVGEKAHMKGNVFAKDIVVSGKIEGNLFGSEHVELTATGHVRGDIRTLRLSIADGAVFNGMSTIDSSEQESLEKNVVEYAAQA